MSKPGQPDNTAQETAISAAKAGAKDAAMEAERAARARGLTDEDEPFVQRAAGDAYDAAYSDAYDEATAQQDDELSRHRPHHRERA